MTTSMTQPALGKRVAGKGPKGKAQTRESRERARAAELNARAARRKDRSG